LIGWKENESTLCDDPGELAVEMQKSVKKYNKNIGVRNCTITLGFFYRFGFGPFMFTVYFLHPSFDFANLYHNIH
jgi:hypothetical protein